MSFSFTQKASFALVGSLLGSVAVAIAPAEAVTFEGPTPYLQSSDSPYAGIPSIYSYLEDFEDGALNTPGVSASAGFVLGPANLTDSVDEDGPGGVDGIGNDAYSYYSANNSSLTFTFDATVLGALPTYAGITWTDVGFTTSGPNGFGDVVFEAFNELGVSLGTVIGQNLGDGAFAGQTAEDRFFGVRYAGGISSIAIRMPTSLDWEVDHLQYGQATPVPTPALLPGLVGLGLSVWRKRKHKAIEHAAEA